jgi:L-iditol 2-dehydrogenase
MKTTRLYGVGDLRVEEVGRPAISADDEALIRIHACGICPSDVRPYSGVRSPSHPFPYTRVVCGECHYCIRGLHNFCEDLRRERVRGGFAEYGMALASNLLKIPENVSYAEACFCEPLACCVNGSLGSGIKFGDKVVIIGAGPIGLLHLQLARHSGARVAVSDLISNRLKKAEELGADEVIHASQEDPVQRVSELTGGYGADVVIVCVGARRALQQALDMVGICGTVNFFAGTYPPTTLDIDPNLIHYKQIRLTGSHDFNPFHFQTALRLMEMGMVKVAPIVSHELPLRRVEEGFDIVAERKGLKVIIRMDLTEEA